MGVVCWIEAHFSEVDSFGYLTTDAARHRKSEINIHEDRNQVIFDTLDFETRTCVAPDHPIQASGKGPNDAIDVDCLPLVFVQDPKR